MDTHPPEPCLVHRLSAAPNFVGREAELSQLRRFWHSGAAGVLALVGLGGAGKTAVAARFLDELLKPASANRPSGLFVWSFYQDADASNFLQALYRYFAGGGSAIPAKGAGLLHFLREAMLKGGPHLLVLDGLERVQRQESDKFGQIDDPLLRALLSRCAERLGRVAVLVTSRFPLSDVTSFQGAGYHHVDIGSLSAPAALALLRRRGVKGDDEELLPLVEAYGAHALTLDHLGGIIGQFLDGDPRRAPEAPGLTEPGSDRQALRLARLLRAYEENLAPAELALLHRLCLLRVPATAEHLLQLFLCSPAIHLRQAREIGDLVRRPSWDFFDQGFEGLASSISAIIEEAICQQPIAGPAESFRQEVLDAAATVVELEIEQINIDVEEFIRLYDDLVGPPSERRPLPREDRVTLATLAIRYKELREHPFLPFEGKSEVFLGSKGKVFFGKQQKTRESPPKNIYADLTPDDVWRAYLSVRRKLCFLALKHLALRRVRELCRLQQKKWLFAGALAPLEADELLKLLGRLVERHLVILEADGTYSVHPAVRDYFGRATADQGTLHDLIREMMISLAQKPGRKLPEDRATLDLVEEAIHHGLQAGRAREAWDLYQNVLGGVRHLGWKLGEPVRGLRILRSFAPCPDRWAIAWYLRALGEFEEAYAQSNLTYFRADVRLLQGRLPEVAREQDDARAAFAAFLMGQTQDLPADLLSTVPLRLHALLCLGRLDQLGQAARIEQLYREIGWEGERTRCQLLLAEAARRQNDRAGCRQLLDAATPWVLHSGSVEHLCLFHQVRARLSLATGDGETAQRAVDEGLHIARHCGLVLDAIELLGIQAEICLARRDPKAAEEVAGAAWERALASDCRFVWGAASAGHLLGQALLSQRDLARARPILERTLALRQQIGDPLAEETARLLAASVEA